MILLFGVVHVLCRQQCQSVPPSRRAPCGQNWDHEDRCLAKTCCYDPNDKVNPCYYPGGEAVLIRHVHIIQASHFDAGFADTCAGILTLWWYTHLPRAVRLGMEIENNATLKGSIALQFTAQSWILDMFYRCPPHMPGLTCPTPTQINNVTIAIRKGWITWHAFPFNAEADMYSPATFAGGIASCHLLDDQFGFPRKQTMSQRDVPGTTRGVITALKASGVYAMSIGANGASTPPFVPRAFVWMDRAANASMLMMMHPYGYGDITYEDAVIIPGCDHALVFNWNGDNAGPNNNVDEIVAVYAQVQKEFPGASVFSSTFDNFTQHVANNQTLLDMLPVVEKELGDTWMHGAGADPFRAAFLKRASRLVDACDPIVDCNLTASAAFRNFSMFLLKCGEHTWGKDVETFLGDAVNWSNVQLVAQLALGNPRFLDMVSSWHEQRAMCVDYALGALDAGRHPLAAKVREAYSDLRPAGTPDLQGFVPFPPGTVYKDSALSIGFDALSGSLTTLLDERNGKSWAVGEYGLAYLQYVTLSSDDYTTFTGLQPDGYYPLYSGPPPKWYSLDFGKPNMSLASPAHQEVVQTLRGLWIDNTSTPLVTTFLTEVFFEPASLSILYGAPASAWMRYEIRGANIDCTLEIFNKTATRLPEGMFLRFSVPPSTTWSVNKLAGSPIDPFDVVPGGNNHQHGYWGWIAASNGASSLTLASDDFATAHFGAPWPLPTPTLVPADPALGGGFLLWDNTWGTNYPQWMPWTEGDESQRWRFQIIVA